MKKFKITVEKVTGFCSCNYKEGDVFYVQGMNTPEKEFCGGAFLILYPIQVALHSGGRFSFENNPLCKTQLACPDNGNVIFSIELIPNENSK